MNRIQVLLVGDSDIARWPQQLWPCVEKSAVSYSGQSGAVLSQMPPFVKAMLDSVEASPATQIFIVFCCGENDIAQGLDIQRSRENFAAILNSIMDRRPDIHVLVLGPKFEPWMKGDEDSQADYRKMNDKFRWECKHHRVVQQITYIDCLTMFCKQKDTPDPSFFDSDKLHLNDKGYVHWKNVVEEHIQEILKRPKRK